jgi:ABC-2 type transport system permease protein
VNRIAAIAGKELLHIIREPRTLIAVLLMPIFQLFLFSYALSFDVKNIPTAVVDQDLTATSRTFIDAFHNSGYFQVTQVLGSIRQVDGVFDRGEDRAVVVVLKGFGDRVAAGETGAAAVLIDGSEPNAAQLGQAYATGLTRAFSGVLTADALRTQGVDPAQLGGIRPAIRVWYNPEGRSALYLIPGLIVVLIMTVTVQQTANTLVREKESGTMEQIIAAPIRPIELMVGKLAPWVGLAAIDVVGITLIGLFLFGVPFRGDVALYALASVLFVAGCLGFGLVISARAQSTEVANLLAVILSLLPGFLLSDFVFPIRNMPVVLQWVTYLFPARYYMAINRTLFLKGPGLAVLWPQYVGLGVYAAVMLLGASLLYQRRVG